MAALAVCGRAGTAIKILTATAVIATLLYFAFVERSPVTDDKGPFSSMQHRDVVQDSLTKFPNLRHLNANADDWMSQVSNIPLRSQFQKAQVDRYCKDYEMNESEGVERKASRSLFLDSEHKLAFCIAPKLASTHTKQFLAALNGIIDKDEAFEKFNHTGGYYHPDEYRLSSLSREKRREVLKQYFKILMVRNPLERIVSVYRDKFERQGFPKAASKRGVMHLLDPIKIEILKTYRPAAYERWEKSGRTLKVLPTFGEFIQYLHSHISNYAKLDPHFRPLQHICHPCLFRFDFYPNLKLMPGDFDLLYDKFNLPKLFKNYPAHQEVNTTDTVPSYFKRLNLTEKKMVYEFAHQELLFYYYIYPEEKDMHIPLIGDFS